MYTQLYLHQPLKPKLQELGIPGDAEAAQFALAVVNFQSPVGAKTQLLLRSHPIWQRQAGICPVNPDYRAFFRKADISYC